MLWGIDLGGTKIEGVILSSINGPEVLLRKRIPTEQEKGYRHILQQIQHLLDLMSAEVGSKPQKVGVGTPGTLDPDTHKLKNSNTVCLNHQVIVQDLQSMLNMEVVIANDANCFALAESRLGVVKKLGVDADVVFGVIMGTGVGGGLVVHGNIVQGRHGIAGEWGHNFLDDSGGECYCGQVGCVETVISGPAIEQFYYSTAGSRKKLPEIVALHRAGRDRNASKAVKRLTHYFGKAISIVIDIVDPDIIVIGGGLGNIDELYSDGVQSAKCSVFNSHLETVFAKPALGDSAGVFGAAMLVSEG
jgi:fructokinase